MFGRHAVRQLSDVHTVHAVVRTMPEQAIPGVAYHVLDLAAADWPADALPPRVDVVIHLAQSAKYHEFPQEALDIFRVNVWATARLLDYARMAGASSFVFTSSGGIYGGGPAPFCEDAPAANASKLGYYLVSKVSGELMVNSYAEYFTPVVLRPLFGYGPGQRRTMLIPRLVDRVRAGQPIVLRGDDGLRVNPVHVDDAVALLACCLDGEPPRVINVAGPEVLSLREIATLIGERVGRAPVFESAPGAPLDLIGNNRVMASMVGRPLVRFHEGVNDVI